jgi:4-alpha-glucanotransferase
VVQREASDQGLPEPPASSVATLNTHDMPTWAGFWHGDDVPLREELGLIDREQATRIQDGRRSMRLALPGSLPESGLRPDPEGTDPRASLEAALEWLAAGPAAIVQASLGDLLLEPEPQNVPGTGPERPNWRRRYPWTLEELGKREEIASLLERIDRIRRAEDDGTPPS